MELCVYIDGDGVSAKSRRLVERLNERSVRVIIVSNHRIHTHHTATQLVICDQHIDAADEYIYTHSKPHDAVITRDLLLAQKLLHRHSDSICILSDQGERYFAASIDARIKRSEVNKTIRCLFHTQGKKLTNSKLKKYRNTELSDQLEKWRLKGLRRQKKE